MTNKSTFLVLPVSSSFMARLKSEYLNDRYTPIITFDANVHSSTISYSSNLVTLTYGLSATEAGSDDLSGM